MTDEALWWIALAAGLIVLLVAVGLLQVFLNHVRRIERAAEAIWHAGKRVAENTATTWQLNQTEQRLNELAEEAGRHDELLGQRTAGSR